MIAEIQIDTSLCLDLYRRMYLIRRFEQRAGELYRGNEIPGFIHLYVGEEATGVGVLSLLETKDTVTSTHRGHGHLLAKGGDPKLAMAELYGRAAGYCGGRGGTMHLFAPEIGFLGTNGFVGGGIPAAVGAGLSAKLNKTHAVSVALFGDGAINHGAFHESMNLAAAWRAPVLFVCENNLYATATPFIDVTGNPDIAGRAAAYGMPGECVDGQDVLAVRAAATRAIDRARAGDGPTLLECRTYRYVGHHEGDPPVGNYRTAEEIEEWKKRDPLLLMEARLSEIGGKQQEIRAIREEVETEIEQAIEFARAGPHPDPNTLEHHVFAVSQLPADSKVENRKSKIENQTCIEAVRDAIADAMRDDASIIYLGEGTGERGGSFAHTKGLYQEFGPDRMIDTPISELGFTGAAIGAAANGLHPIVDLMFIDFAAEAMSQIVNQAAKAHYLSNGKLSVPVVIRAPMGHLQGGGAHHSGCLYPWFMHIPGLKVVTYSTPDDGYGLMRSALRDPNPVLFLDHKGMFNVKGGGPYAGHFVPFGEAKIFNTGTDCTVVAVGMMAHRAREAADQLRGEISVEVVDPRTLVPLDIEAILASVAKTGRLLIVDEAYPVCSLASEIAARVAEQSLYDLDAPIRRLNTRAVTHPISPILEKAMIPQVEDIVREVRELMNE